MVYSLCSTRNSLNFFKTFFSTGYPIPESKKEEIRNEIQRLADLNIIRKSTSDFYSPAFGILKKSGEIRIVVDYRVLNSMAISLSFPPPNIQELKRIFLA